MSGVEIRVTLLAGRLGRSPLVHTTRLLLTFRNLRDFLKWMSESLTPESGWQRWEIASRYTRKRVTKLVRVRSDESESTVMYKTTNTCTRSIRFSVRNSSFLWDLALELLWESNNRITHMGLSVNYFGIHFIELWNENLGMSRCELMKWWGDPKNSIMELTD